MIRSRSGIWTAALAAMAVAGCGSAPVPRDLTARKEVSRVQHVLGLTYPYRITNWDYYRDGGSIGVLVNDRFGRHFQFFFKVPEYPPFVPTDTSLADTLRMAPRYFWSGGDRQMRGARKLSIGGPEELAILDMLDVISLDYLARPARDRLVADVLRHEKTKEDISRVPTTAIWAGSLAGSARNRDPRGPVVWIRGKGWQI